MQNDNTYLLLREALNRHLAKEREQEQARLNFWACVCKETKQSVNRLLR